MSAKTAGYAVTHKPLGKGKRNGPWGTGQLPAYVQNVADGIRDDGTPLGRAIQIAIGRVRGWAAGKGNVRPEVRAAAQKAVAELDALLAKAKGKRLVEADVAGAADRIALLERLGLPVTGPGAEADVALLVKSILLEGEQPRDDLGRYDENPIIGGANAGQHVLVPKEERRPIEAEAPQSTRVVEAVAAASFLGRVEQLEPGELARLADGGAVRHTFTGDGRKVWTAGSPSRYGDSDGISWNTPRDTAEEAVAEALTDSARRSSPDSVGGPTSWGKYGTILVNGQPAEFFGVSQNVNPLVRIGGREAQPTTWSSLTPAPRRLVEASDRSRGGEPTHHHKARSHRHDKGKGAASSAASTVTRAKGVAGQNDRAALKRDLGRMDVGTSKTVNGKTVRRVGMGQWSVDGRSHTSEDEALTAVMRPVAKPSPTSSGSGSASGKSFGDFQVSDKGSIKAEGVGADGNKIRVRQPTGGTAYVVEVQKADKSWSAPAGHFTTEKAAGEHFMRRVQGGDKGAIADMGERIFGKPKPKPAADRSGRVPGSREARAHEHAKTKAGGRSPYSSDVAEAMMNAEQHATVDALKASKNLADVKASEAVPGDSGDVRIWFRKRYSNGKPGPAQKATVKPDGTVVDANGKLLRSAPAPELVKAAKKKVVLKG